MITELIFFYQSMKYSKLDLAKEAIKHKGFISKIPHIFRMLKAAKSGRYKMKKTSLIFPALVLVYILSPLDILPDLIPVVGVLDDLGLLALAIPVLMKEVDKFLLWELERKEGITTIEVVPK